MSQSSFLQPDQADQASADTGASTAADAATTDPSLGDVSAEDAFNVALDTVRGIVTGFLEHLPLLIAGLIVLIATFLLVAIAKRIAARLLRGTKIRNSLRELVIRFTAIVAWSLGLLTAALVIFPGLTPSKALAALGVGSIAIGLAFKDIFENFFAGVLILWKFPIENGDFIECNGVMGKVEDVTIRNTLIRTVRGELVVMPNSVLYKNAVDVLTNRPQRRVSIIAGVAYDEDVAESREVIREAVTSCASVSSEHEPQIFAQEFASSSVNFEVAWWTGSTPLEQRESRDEVVEAIKTALDDASIEIPFPYRTLTFKEPLALRDRDASGDDDPE